MRREPQVALLPDGRRLHLQDGPIDLIVEATGSREAVVAAYRAAADRLTGLLDGLCAELALLRSPAGEHLPVDPVGRAMLAAVRPHSRTGFITPMAAVAGAVADAVLAAMVEAAPLSRAFVNNGGDIALHLAPGESFAIGLIDRPDRPSLFARSIIHAADGIRGIATSGCRGRSFSLGIADAVTVLARTAAEADAAATVVANAVDLPGHPAVHRVAACELQPDSDLAALPVTRAVGPLAPAEVRRALEAGRAVGEALARDGLIVAAALHLAGQTATTGAMALAAA
ncbi:UPF0280 family protein [Jiella sonneratiae]|uniref:UPF0280 family protein n=1 Tax=Jiella sonneratiae TaxID=2816856 RepID=A0ABS3IXD2_9HYPH|nr:UPF0280 family protein [Jiella sonneratiae]MBO0902072.1 UPF0280 family protein [Jiella sonneratiae]